MKSGVPVRLIGLVLLVALAGCRPAGGDDGGPPAGGWPQPAGDHVTAGMCGLLTDADYSRLGHVRRTKLNGSVTDRANSVYCQYKGSDDMTLSLQPSADFAKYEFAAELAEHKGQLAEGHRRSALVSGVVGAADESWFDYWGPAPADARAVAHEIRVRRGALILDLTLSGVRGKHEKDPRSVLVDLADLVLRRLPHVGAKDTGTQHKIEYEAIGTGKAHGIDWNDYTHVQQSGSVSRVRLPWLHMVPMAAADGARVDSLYLKVEASSPKRKVGCLIVVDGVPVAGVKPRPGFADCEADFPDTGDTSGSGAQPAGFTPHSAGPLPSRPNNGFSPQEVDWH
jgi:hypothetical protein